MTSIPDLFDALRREKRKSLMPFVTAGELGLKFTAAMIEELIAG